MVILKKKIVVTGTLRTNRKGLPNKIVSAAKQVLKKGVIIEMNNVDFNCILWLSSGLPTGEPDGVLTKLEIRVKSGFSKRKNGVFK